MSNLQPLAVKIAKQYSLPVQTFLRLVKQESGWQPNVVSKMGAQGLTQLMPATAASLGVSNPFDPQQNLDGGARYLRQQFDKFGSWRLALAAYNAGPGNVESGEWRRFKETQRYVASILGPQADDEVSPTGGVSNDGNSNATKPAALTPVPLTARSLVAFSDPLWGTDQLAKTAFENLNKIAQGWKPTSLMAGLVDASQRQSAYAQAAAAQAPLSTTTAPPLASSVPTTRATSSPSTKPRSLRAPKVVADAEKYLGTPYLWGGTTPGGFDCSGLLQYVWGKQGVHIPRVTYDQFTYGTSVAKGQLRPGDAVFFKGSDSIVRDSRVLPGHVGMYVGGGKFIEAPRTGLNVRISTLAGRGDYMGARRYG